MYNATPRLYILIQAMKIHNEIHENTGRFFIEDNNKTVAELDFTFPAENTLLVVHTEVSEDYGGKGAGKELVAAAADYARKNSLSLKASCSYAKVVLARGKEYADIYTAEK